MASCPLFPVLLGCSPACDELDLGLDSRLPRQPQRILDDGEVGARVEVSRIVHVMPNARSNHTTLVHEGVTSLTNSSPAPLCQRGKREVLGDVLLLIMCTNLVWSDVAGCGRNQHIRCHQPTMSLRV